VVPPVPWRRLAFAGVGLAAALALIGAFAIPRVERSKQEAAEVERREARERQAAERRRLTAEQRPVHGRAPQPAGPLSPSAELRARGALLGAVEGAITAEARRRVAAGTLTGRILRTECVPAPAGIERAGADAALGRRRDAYDCVAVTRDIPATSVSRAGSLGHPFRAVVDFERFTFVLCKTNPPPGEGAIPDPRRVVPLPRACRRP
jgi:hypothetical protein